MLIRSWIAFTGILALALAVMCTLSVLQFGAVQVRLVQDRMAVVAISAAGPLRSVIALGLPISTVRNAKDLLARAKAIDPLVQDIKVFHQSGIVVHATENADRKPISKAIMFDQSVATADHWASSESDRLFSGLTLRGKNGTPIGGILVSTNSAGPEAAVRKTTSRIVLATIGVWLAFAAVGYLVLMYKINALVSGLEKLRDVAERFRSSIEDTLVQPNYKVKPNELLRREVSGVEGQLESAFSNYQIAEGELSRFHADEDVSGLDGGANSVLQDTVLATQSGGQLSKAIVRHLMPSAAIVLLCAILILAIVVQRTVTASFTPELAARTALIGDVANRNIQQAIDAGVPLESLVGAEDYFDELLSNFPEVSYFGIATGRIVYEAGTRQETLFAPRQSRKGIPTFPIRSGDEQIGYILIDANPNFFSTEFREILLDFGVVLLVVILLTQQAVTLVVSRALAAPFVQLQYLAALQATGDFSKTMVARGTGAIAELSKLLADNAEALHARVRVLTIKGVAKTDADRFRKLQDKFSIKNDHPSLLRFAYLNDLRLPLFLFTAADELPLAFFPLYTRAADNPLTWLNSGVLLSLPLAGYLIAIVLASPLTGPLVAKLGYRKLLLVAVAPAIIAHIGLFFATTTIEIILYRTLSGVSYAIVTLACQDYVLDAVNPVERPKALATFTGAAYSGIFAGAALGGVLADRLGQSEVFMVSAGLALVSGIMIFQLLPKVTAAIPIVTKKSGMALSSIWKSLKNRRFLALVMGIAIPANIVQQAFISYLVALQLHDLGASIADTGRILMTYFLAIVIVGPLPSWLIQRGIRPSWIALLGALISTASLSCLLIAPGMWIMLLTVIGTGVGIGIIRDTQVTITMNIIERDPEFVSSAATLGTLRTIERLSSVVGLVALAFLASVAGYGAAIAALMALLLGGALIFAIATFRKALG